MEIIKEDILTKLKELQFEFANYKKRTEKEKSEMINCGKGEMLKTILPIIDDLELAIKYRSSDSQTFKQAICLSYIKLIQTLQKEGVEIMPTIGEVFNPDLHEAIGVAHNGETGLITECSKQGYIYNGKVIRHAQVVVNN